MVGELLCNINFLTDHDRQNIIRQSRHIYKSNDLSDYHIPLSSFEIHRSYFSVERTQNRRSFAHGMSIKTYINLILGRMDVARIKNIFAPALRCPVKTSRDIYSGCTFYFRTAVGRAARGGRATQCA